MDFKIPNLNNSESLSKYFEYIRSDFIDSAHCVPKDF